MDLDFNDVSLNRRDAVLLEFFGCFIFLKTQGRRDIFSFVFFFFFDSWGLVFYSRFPMGYG